MESRGEVSVEQILLILLLILVFSVLLMMIACLVFGVRYVRSHGVNREDVNTRLKKVEEELNYLKNRT